MIDTAQAVICTWLQLERAMYALHLGNKDDIERLHDVWLSGVPAPDYTVAVVGAAFDERKPRPGDNFKHVVSPLALAKWIEDVSAKRGFPYSSQQALDVTQGQATY